MVESLPISFPVPGESAIASYDWVDVSNGNGYVKYYLSTIISGTGTLNYTLSNSGIYADSVAWQSAALTKTVNTLVFDNIFTTYLNTPKVVNGNVIVNVAAKAGGIEACKIRNDAYFIKIVGGVETTLGQVSGALITATSGTPVMDHEIISSLIIPITNQNIRKGDQIGVRLKTYAWKTADSTPSLIYMGFDPMNRTSSLTGPNILTTTNSQLNVPFRIDL